MSLDPRIGEAFSHLPDFLAGHVLVSLAALTLGLAVSLPLALLAGRRPRLQLLLLGLVSVVQTVPGLALLALFYPLLLALSALCERLFGTGFSALGFLPAVLALALYAMLPVLRNTVTALAGIDPAVKEAAEGVGMTPRQSLLMVELPLALPVIMAGIRTAAVWVIGTATLATPIGQTSLGNYIFTGLQTQNWVLVAFGCVAAAALALAVDQLLALMQNGLARRSRTRVSLGALGLVAIGAIALLPALARAPAGYVVGGKPFAEQHVLTALIAQRLRAAGLPVSQRAGLGSNLMVAALANNEVDVAVDYTGTIWANEMARRDVPPRAEVLAGVADWLKRGRGITVLGALGFENAYALAMTRARARALGIRTLADLARRAGALSIAGDYEFFARPEWAALRRAYGLNFRSERQMQPEFMYQALVGGEVDAIAAYTSDGQIARHDLLVLEDPQAALPPYDAIVLVSPRRADDERLREALRPLIGAIGVATMRQANLRASGGDGDATADAVARWLWAQIGGR